MGWCTLSIKVNEKEVFAIHLEDKDIQKVYWNEHILFEANKFESSFDGVYPDRLWYALDTNLNYRFDGNGLMQDHTQIHPVTGEELTIQVYTKSYATPIIEETTINDIPIKTLTVVENSSKKANYLSVRKSSTSLLAISLLRVDNTTISNIQGIMNGVGIDNLNSFTLTNSGNTTYAKYYGGERFGDGRPYWCILWSFGTSRETYRPIGSTHYRSAKIQYAEFLFYEATVDNYVEIKDAVIEHLKEKYNLI